MRSLPMSTGRTPVLPCLLGACLIGFAAPACATNGMNMEGYGAVATALGGASQAYDNGTAAMMNNPATLALMEPGRRADLAYGFLGPTVEARYGAMTARSRADAFSMPAFGWMKKTGELAWGFGIYGQGGMGTEYAGDSFMSAGSGLTTRSELSVGRVILPLAYTVSPRLSVGATVDFVWMGLDLQMAMNGAQMQAMGALGQGSVGGSLAAGLASLGATDVAYFDFSNDSRFTGQARGYGAGGKLGLVYELAPTLRLGASWHSRTAVSDMSSDRAQIRLITAGGTSLLSGRIRIHDFQWPETWSAGLAWQPHRDWLLVADWKRLQWARVMKDFRMRFDADAGGDLELTLNQNWNNQNVFMLGVAWQTGPRWTLRAGANLAANPVPDALMHPLFPAIVRNHVTAGVGYAFDRTSSLDFGLTHGFRVEATNAAGVTVSHRQTNWQLVYGRRY